MQAKETQIRMIRWQASVDRVGVRNSQGSTRPRTPRSANPRRALRSRGFKAVGPRGWDLAQLENHRTSKTLLDGLRPLSSEGLNHPDEMKVDAPVRMDL